MINVVQAAESRIESYNAEIMSLKEEIRGLVEKLEIVNTKAQSFEGKAKIAEQGKIHLEQKYLSEFKRFEEVQERCRNAEREAKRATELADKARSEAVAAQKDKNDLQRLAMERLAAIERDQRHIESLERDKSDLSEKLKEARMYESEAQSKIALLEARVEEKGKELESLMESNNEQRASSVELLESLLDTERKARAEANSREEDLSLKLQAAQSKIDSLQQKLTTVLLNEKALDSKLKTASLGKRVRAADDAGEGGEDMDIDRSSLRGIKRTRNSTPPLNNSFQFEDGDENGSQTQQEDDYTKFTVAKLKSELTKHNHGAEVLQLKNPHKKDLIVLYEKLVLNK